MENGLNVKSLVSCDQTLGIESFEFHSTMFLNFELQMAERMSQLQQ